MCGIFGRVNRNSNIDQELFLRQLNTLSKRGPDAFGTYFDNNVGLGQRRLAIVDLSENGIQPMFNEARNLSLVFNGEIYNFRQVLSKLKEEHQLKSRSDSEALLHGYEEFGTDLTKYIDGMFAFCIYDRKERKLFFARDHFGKKPFYYYHDEDTFVFGSEIKALIEDVTVKKKLQIDPSSVEKFMFYGYVPSPHTIYKQIHKLEPSSFMIFDISRWQITENTQYWFPEKIKISNVDQETAIEDIDVLLDKSVEKRLMSDVPLGIFLSGGLDSSLVAHYLSNKTKNLSSYTVSYPEERDIDESKYAQIVAEQNGFKYNLVDFVSSDVLPSFETIFSYLDEPLADAAIVPLYYISKHSKKDMTVVLGGDGGDELFAGYPKYAAQKFIESNKWFNPFAGLAEKALPANLGFKKMISLYKESFEARQFMFGSGSFMPNEVKQLLSKDIKLDSIFEDAFLYSSKFEQTDVVNKATYLDWKLQLPDWYLVKSDRAAMANSQELRSPFLDKDLAEYALSIPGSLKMKNGESKYLLKHLALRYYPSDFVNRKKKGFGVPLNKWIKNELKDIFETYINKDNGIVNRAFACRLLEEHLSGVADHRFKLLRIFSFNFFYEQIYK